MYSRREIKYYKKFYIIPNDLYILHLYHRKVYLIPFKFKTMFKIQEKNMKMENGFVTECVYKILGNTNNISF